MIVKDTWFRRDLPVLEALVELCDAELFALVSLRAVADKTGLPVMEVGLAARALDDAGLIDLNVMMTGGDPSPWIVSSVSSEARQLTGAWPTSESLAQRLLDELADQEASEDDPKKKQWLTRVLAGAGELGRATTVEVLSGAIARTISGI